MATSGSAASPLDPGKPPDVKEAFNIGLELAPEYRPRNVTLLATDAVGGLMVRDRSGCWLDAPVVPDAFICNIGDCLMRWSNDVNVSTPHKVVSPPGRERYSVAFFLDPNPDAMVACLPTCTSPERPARYQPITGADFLRSRLEPTYASVKT